MYRHIQDFLDDRKNEESNTIKIFSEITEETKSTKIHENVRSLARLAWHITQSITEIGTHAGLFETNPTVDYPEPETMVEMIEVYKRNNALLAQTLRSKWTDSSLQDEVPMYGEVWKKGQVLTLIAAHEAHHRSQMTVIMRMLGLSVPGLYGPSKEEWIAYGMPAME